MDQPGSLIPFSAAFLLLSFLLGSSNTLYSQQKYKPWHDSSRRKRSSQLADTLRSTADTLYSIGKNLFANRRRAIRSHLKQIGDSPFTAKNLRNKFAVDTSYKNVLANPFKNLVITKPWIKATDGYLHYQFNYRSNIDTPYLEKNIGQHSAMARLNFILGGIAPFSVNYWGRRSNSGLFRDINDVQVSFNATEFANGLQSAVRKRLLAIAPQLKDSLAAQLLGIKWKKLSELDRWLNGAAQLQRYVGANEIIKIPRATYDPDLPDSVNADREESLKKVATAFMDLYNRTNEEYNKLSKEVDSLQKVYEQSLIKLKRFQQIINGKGNDLASYGKWKHQLTELGLGAENIPASYRWLLGIRKFSLGRSVINQSELTAKNISINGINIEYNSWYYVAVTAGLIDYRFRDFVISPAKKTPQFLYMVRLGIGRLEGNHVIASAFRGQKQLFTGSVNRGGLRSINTMGYSVEIRYAVTKTSYITAEMAESVSPDFRNVPAGTGTKIGLADKTNNAYALRLFSYLPKTHSRLEAMYKYTGANFQSFSSFQTNSGQKAWYIKLDQPFFKRQLRITASLRSNDFFNPFIIQQYHSNTIFKSITASFRKKKGPVLTVGYIPMSQITKLGNLLLENRFQTLNASYYHLYKLHKTRAATSLIYNRFYNNSGDSSFLYYNAVNIYGAQSFYFRLFSISVGTAYTKNNNYNLLVMDENVNWNFQQWGTVGFGVKVNKYNEEELKLGAYVNANIRIGQVDMLSFSIEKGYLPGYRGGLVRNDMATIQYSKAFRIK